MQEEKINYNHFTKEWQVRGDEDHHPFKYQQSRVVLQGAKPYVDQGAHEGGKKLYAYLQGKVAKDIPKGHIRRGLTFQPGNLDHPFVHSDDGSPVTHADYVEFTGKNVVAHYKS